MGRLYHPKSGVCPALLHVKMMSNFVVCNASLTLKWIDFSSTGDYNDHVELTDWSVSVFGSVMPAEQGSFPARFLHIMAELCSVVTA